MNQSRLTLVVGGSGYIGRHVLSQLGSAESLSIPHTDMLGGCSVAKWKQKLCPQERLISVLHLAGGRSPKEAEQDPQRYLNDNLLLARQVSEFARSIQARNVVFGSSSAVYGVRPSTYPSSIGVYSETKAAVEEELRRGLAQTGTKVCAARIFNVTGRAAWYDLRGGDAGFPRHALESALQDRSVTIRTAKGSTSEADDVGPVATRDFIDVRDVARALVLLLRSDHALETVDVGTGNSTGLTTVVELVAEIAGRPVELRFERLPDWEILHSCADSTGLASLGFHRDYSLRDSIQSLMPNRVSNVKDLGKCE